MAMAIVGKYLQLLECDGSVWKWTQTCTELKHIQNLLQQHFPHSIKLLGHVMMSQRLSNVFSYHFYLYHATQKVSQAPTASTLPQSKTVSDRVSDFVLTIHPAEMSGWTTTGSTAVFATSKAILRRFLIGTKIQMGQHQEQNDKRILPVSVIDWNKAFTIADIPHTYISELNTVCADLGHGLLENKVTSNLFYLVNSDGLVSESDVAKRDADYDIIVKPINVSDLGLIASTWENVTPQVIERFKAAIQHCNTVGVYVCKKHQYHHSEAEIKSQATSSQDVRSHQLVSWVFETPYCPIGTLYTLSNYRGRGYGKLAISELSREHLKEYGFAYAFVETDNEASRRLFTSLGFSEFTEYTHHWLLHSLK